MKETTVCLKASRLSGGQFVLAVMLAAPLALAASAARHSQTPKSPLVLAANYNTDDGGSREPGRAATAARGLDTSDWAGIRSAYERHRHSAVETTNGWMMGNAEQQWQAHFDDKGLIVQPDDSSWSWGLSLNSYGFRGYEVAPSVPPTVTANGPRVSYDRDDTVQEWSSSRFRQSTHSSLSAA